MDSGISLANARKGDMVGVVVNLLVGINPFKLEVGHGRDIKAESVVQVSRGGNVRFDNHYDIAGLGYGEQAVGVGKSHNSA